MTVENTRGFEKISAYANDEAITLPRRSTTLSAGYDIAAAEDIVVPAMWKTGVKHVLKDLARLRGFEDRQANCKYSLSPI